MKTNVDKREQPIAFFDSGIGGLTVLAFAARLLPAENYVYFGDTANAPYGSKSKEEVRALSVQAADMLLRRGTKALVVACNTATSAAVDLLRGILPVPVIGMEPAVKPAVRRGGKVLVMATPLTLREEKFRNLCESCGADPENLTVLPCPGLVELIERGEIAGTVLEAKLGQLLAGLDTNGITTAVLGCTHYIFIKETLRKFLPADVELIDGNLGTVRQLQRILIHDGLLRSTSDGGKIDLTTSGGSSTLSLFQEMYKNAYDKTEGCR